MTEVTGRWVVDVAWWAPGPSAIKAKHSYGLLH
jgi:hypothetical protein